MQDSDRRRRRSQERTALVAARDAATEPDTEEAIALADTAGYEVVGAVTQRRVEDPDYWFGRGKAEELMRRVTNTGVDTVVFDGPLSPKQAYTLGELCPDGTQLLDRHRLVLDIFAERAGTREAGLQVRLAELRYELPRVKMAVRLERQAANERTASGAHAGQGGGRDEKEHRRVRDLRERIERIGAKLDSLGDVAADRRARRHAAGFDLVAVAGYTNAGKSTLFQRLATDLDLGENDRRHPDEHSTAAADDGLFETLDTTTRRAELDGRRVLLTDTVGFVADLPPWLVESFETTLSAAYAADAVLLLADASDPVDRIREKVTTSREILADGVRGELLPVLTKVDRVPDEAAADLRAAVAGALSAEPEDVAAISTHEGDGLETLERRVAAALPRETATFDVPNDGETQSLLSWAHDHGVVHDVTYTGDRVRFGFEARPAVVERARSRATR
ncbi:GTPase HflX [Halobium salinum]|uniref:GTPase HflX n=1 Tax=Halobium salinum TaxID=1364940 RepID=A0ABD5PGV2_9EURY|nr:GTPase HflX [Halobium salinum]